jgi:hypothetical protein
MSIVFFLFFFYLRVRVSGCEGGGVRVRVTPSTISQTKVFVKYELKGVLKCITVKIWTHSLQTLFPALTDRYRHSQINVRNCVRYTGETVVYFRISMKY